MTRITYTRPDDDAPHLRFGDVQGQSVEFPRGERVVDIAPEDALWADETIPDVRLVADLPTDYDTLRALASAAETDEVDGNAEKLRLIDWFDGLDAERRDELRQAVEDDA